MANNNTIIKVPPPRFGINEVVYNRESSLLGYLEAMRIVGVQFDPEVGRNFYYFTFKKTAISNQTVGDANTLKHSNTIKIIEEELLTYCEALDYKIGYLQQELTKSLALRCQCSAPVASSISPDSGIEAGNNAVSIFGSGFTGAIVTIGGVIVEILTITDTVIVINMPPHDAGVVSIKISAPGGMATINYTYISTGSTGS